MCGDCIINLAHNAGRMGCSQVIQHLKTCATDAINSLTKVNIRLAGIGVKSVHLTFIEFSVRISINNRILHLLPIPDISYNFKMGGREVSAGAVNSEALEASDKTNLEFILKVPYDIVISIIRDVGSDWDVDYEIHVHLTFHVPIISHITIPLSKTGEIKLPKLPFSDNLHSIKDSIDDIHDSIKDSIEDIKDHLPSIPDRLPSIKDSVEDIQDSIKDSIEDIKDHLPSIPDRLPSIKDSVEDIHDSIKDSIDNVHDSVEDIKDSIKDSMHDMKDSIKDSVDDVKDSIKKHLHLPAIHGHDLFHRK
ncbi:uncharacterized protein LOC110820945 [Carica papaya]|uniref:uncharacterized protein LOC110820945 n=1 Tax=Carica papaya TaxID=3649 RepID=UPI000B8CA9E7|nr:uncharacterized protein LOC110820945 [Carica papaya]